MQKLPQLNSVRVEQLKSWYNGYNFGQVTLYNPWSIMQCLYNDGNLGYYWIDSGGTDLISKLCKIESIKDDLYVLLANKPVVTEISKYINFADLNSKAGLYGILLFSGYFGCSVYNSENNIYNIMISNKEVEYIFRKNFEKTRDDI